MTAFVGTPVLQSWGRLSKEPALLASPRFQDQAADLATQLTRDKPGLAIGMGRSYGDSGLNARGRVIAMGGLDRILDFDPQTGLVTAEAGVTLSALLQFLTPKGFFLPATPGSRFVTLGGAVANDVHGKNHHRSGAFGAAVTRLGVARSDGSLWVASPVQNGELFAATIGGMGLTGAIMWVEFKATPITSTRMVVETIPFPALDAFFDLAAESADNWPYTVAWVDCLKRGSGLGRGVFTRARFSDDGKFKAHKDTFKSKVPFTPPGFLLNGITVGAFNAAYFTRQKLRFKRRRAPYADVFYPLDAIKNWNALYGPDGFYQYQCVIPEAAGPEAIRAMLLDISKAGQGSFLAVLKTFGEEKSPGWMSFPMKGVTLALDFPNKGRKTHELFRKLDAIVASTGGRLYPAKDARMPATLFQDGYPNLDRFQRFVDPAFASDFWRRVMA